MGSWETRRGAWATVQRRGGIHNVASGRGRESEHELERAIALFKEKGNEVGEHNARRLLARTRS